MPQIRKKINNIRHGSKKYGRELRRSYSESILKGQPLLPLPLEYEDIDKAFITFVEEELPIIYNGERLPTFTLFSNQRFSEYSQMWRYVDDRDNLLLNFKTVSRENNPQMGDNQGKLWNIPGDRRYIIAMRDTLEENGTESVEIYSIKQPYTIDLLYRISIVSDKNSVINDFNNQVNNKFKARQWYIRPNGHYIPMTLESILDETSYSIDERRIFVQSYTVKVMAYIINKEDMKVEKKPKRLKLNFEGEVKRKAPTVDIEEYYEENIVNKRLTFNISIKAYQNSVIFVSDTDAVITGTETDNVRNVRLFINDVPYFIDKGFRFSEGDEIRIRVRAIDISLAASIVLEGYDPNSTYDKTKETENVSEEVETYKDFLIE